MSIFRPIAEGLFLKKLYDDMRQVEPDGDPLRVNVNAGRVEVDVHGLIGNRSVKRQVKALKDIDVRRNRIISQETK